MKILFQFMNLYCLLEAYENGFFKLADNTCDVSTFPKSRYPFMVSATISATSGYLN